MKSFTLFLTLLLTSVLFTSCQKEELYDKEAEARNASVFIYDSYLIGNWEVNSMIVDRDVDLNGDAKFSDNLLLETSCFETMSFEFRGNKTFTMTTSALGLQVRDDKEVFSCMQEKVLQGNWSLKNDVLYLYVKINQRVHEQKIHLLLSEDSFAFEVNDAESKEYLKDQGGTSASGLVVVSLEYSRKIK
ncbi:lipocalin-like domain-containing protein [Antarcticibacterium arcticum]|nr:lipocalin family protein [Antarcticibacterium arcticum]